MSSTSHIDSETRTDIRSPQGPHWWVRLIPGRKNHYIPGYVVITQKKEEKNETQSNFGS